MRITSHPYSAVNSAGGRLARTQTINALRRGYTQKRERKNTALRRRRGRAGSAANAVQVARKAVLRPNAFRATGDDDDDENKMDEEHTGVGGFLDHHEILEEGGALGRGGSGGVFPRGGDSGYNSGRVQ